ncbi:MAG: hypothetical protein ACRCUG_03570 [Yersinia sp. (in: enterobacteria)]
MTTNYHAALVTSFLLISFDFIYYLTNFDSRIEQLTALFYSRAYCL